MDKGFQDNDIEKIARIPNLVKIISLLRSEITVTVRFSERNKDPGPISGGSRNFKRGGGARSRRGRIFVCGLI